MLPAGCCGSVRAWHLLASHFHSIANLFVPPNSNHFHSRMAMVRCVSSYVPHSHYIIYQYTDGQRWVSSTICTVSSNCTSFGTMQQQRWRHHKIMSPKADPQAFHSQCNTPLILRASCFFFFPSFACQHSAITIRAAIPNHTWVALDIVMSIWTAVQLAGSCSNNNLLI